METKELEQLLLLARRGDQQALTALYEKTQGYAYFIAMRYLQNDEDVKDVLQDAYIAAFNKLDTLREGAAFHSWLGRIVTNHSLNHLRQNQAISSSDDVSDELADDDELIPSAWLEREEKRREILHIIDALPDGQRISIVLFYLEGLSVAEIAAQMELATGTVKAHLYHGRKAIKAAVLKREERGNKLYGLVAMPLLAQLMKMEAQAATMPPQLSEDILEYTLRIATAGVGTGALAGVTLGDQTPSSGRSSAEQPGVFFHKLSFRAKVGAILLLAAILGGVLWFASASSRTEAAAPLSQETPVGERVEALPEADADFRLALANGLRATRVPYHLARDIFTAAARRT